MCLPIGRLEVLQASVCPIDHAHSLALVVRDDSQCFVVDQCFRCLMRLVRAGLGRSDACVENLFGLV